MDEKSIYEQTAELWKHFSSWRDKLFAGYLTVMGALAFAFGEQLSPGRQCIVLVVGVVLSVVFWIHDVRVRELFSAMQGAAANLESTIGGYKALDQIRFKGTSRLTHGLGINILVSANIAGCAAGLFVLVPRWYSASNKSMTTVVIASTILFVLLYLLTRKLGSHEWRSEEHLRETLFGQNSGDRSHHRERSE